MCFYSFLLSFGRIIPNETRLRNVKMCTGPKIFLPSTSTGSRIQMIGVTGDKLIPSATSSGEVKLLSLF